jgi:hypothetical protein
MAAVVVTAAALGLVAMTFMLVVASAAKCFRKNCFRLFGRVAVIGVARGFVVVVGGGFDVVVPAPVKGMPGDVAAEQLTHLSVGDTQTGG